MQLIALGENATEPAQASDPQDLEPVGKVQQSDRPASTAPGDAPPAKERRAHRKATEPLGFEDVLWKAADKLRGSMDSSEYKHVVLGLLFLKYVEDAFEERRAVLRDELTADNITGQQADELLESRDEYTAEGVFWVPPEARWQYLKESAKLPGIGKLIDNAMDPHRARQPNPARGSPQDLRSTEP